jgi:hypothetical protein
MAAIANLCRSEVLQTRRQTLQAELATAQQQEHHEVELRLWQQLAFNGMAIKTLGE